MKTSNLLLVFLFFTTGYINAQWTLQRNFGMLTEFHGIQFIDETHGWIWSAGMYLSTTNGGQTWSVYNNWMQEPPNDLFFVNRDTGFMAATDGIVRKTTNGGQSWQNIQTPVQDPIYRLFFVNETHGWASVFGQNKGYILHTNDGGAHWTIQNIVSETISFTVYSFFYDENLGWSTAFEGSNCSLWKTSSGGHNWNKIADWSEGISIYDIFFINQQTGWIIGGYGFPRKAYLSKTYDGGQTWVDHHLPLLKNRYNQMEEARAITSIQFINDSLGWITCRGSVNGYALLTTDGGITWQQQHIECGNNWGTTIFQDISMITPKKGWVLSVSSIFTTNQADTVIVVNINHQENSNEGLFVFPNPMTHNVTVNFPKGLQPSEISIADISGKVVFTTNYQDQDTLSVHFLAPGIYYLTVNFLPNHQINSLTAKIIKL